MPAQPLTPAQRDDAMRLKQIYERWKSARRPLGLAASQEHVAAELGFKSQSSVSQYMNGVIPLNVTAAAAFAEFFKCDVGDFSRDLADEIAKLSPDNSLAAGHMPIKMVDAKASAGAGHPVLSDDVRSRLMFRRDWLEKHGVKDEDDALAFEVDGDSMIDEHIIHGSVVLANTKKREPTTKGLFVVWVNERLYVKKMIREADHWLARSCNAAQAYPDVTIASEDDRIVGKAFWCGFGL